MGEKRVGWLSGLVLGAALLAPALVCADPPCAGDGFSRRDCPRSEYSPLHYWAPSFYPLRAVVRPSNLDQYPPGFGDAVPAPIDVTKYKCRTRPPMPSSPYADPASYFGRAITLP